MPTKTNDTVSGIGTSLFEHPTYCLLLLLDNALHFNNSTEMCNCYWALINARSIFNKLAEIHLFIESNSLDILGVTETWLNNLYIYCT